ncbi:unnamed protein product [Alopecurus aequalis]
MAARVLLSSYRIAGQLAAASNRGVRSFAAAAVAMTRKEPSATGGAASRLAAAAQKEAPMKDVFWMREPKSGNWMPENHFHDVHPADLRARLLFSKK